MSLDVKKTKSPSSARKSMFSTHTLTDSLFPEFPSHYPDLRTLHEDDLFIQSFERDVLYCGHQHPLLSSTGAPAVDGARRTTASMHTTTLTPPRWEAELGAAWSPCEQQRRTPDSLACAVADESLTEEAAALFRHAFPEHEVVIQEMLLEQVAESFCEGLATEIVERAACVYASRRLDAVQNAYTSLAIWEEVRSAVAGSFLPRDNLGGADAQPASKTSHSNERGAPVQGPVRATMTAAQLMHQARRSHAPTSTLARHRDVNSAALVGSVHSPGSPPPPVAIDHFCRYVVAQALSHGAGSGPDADAEDHDDDTSQPPASAASAAPARPPARAARPVEKVAPPTTAAATSTSGASPSEPDVSSRGAARAKPVTARRPTPPPPKVLLPTGPATVRGGTASADPTRAAQDDLTLALHKVGATPPATAHFGATAPPGSLGPRDTTSSTAASPTATATATRPTGSAASKKDAQTGQKRKPLYRIVGAEAFPAHEVEKERSKNQSRRTPHVASGATDGSAAETAPAANGTDTLYRFKAAKPAVERTDDAARAPSGTASPTDAAKPEVRAYLTADAKRTAQLKEKQRLRRAQEEREQRFVNLADGEATRALLEHQLDVQPQPGVTLKQAGADRSGKRPGQRPTRRQDEAAVLADGGEYVLPDGKKALSGASTNPKVKAAGRAKDAGRALPVDTKSQSDESGRLPRVR